MHIKIYQINLERDNDRVAFLSHDSIARFQGDENIHSEIYDQVFDGEVDCDTLEDVFGIGYLYGKTVTYEAVDLPQDDGQYAPSLLTIQRDLASISAF